MKETKSNNKLLWYILFVIITFIMCYLSIVVYFFFFSPYNISAQLTLWPFVSEQRIAEMYQEATVEINFEVVDQDTSKSEEKNILGINVHRDGYIIAQANEFRLCEDGTEINILTNSGKVYDGEILYCDIDLNLAIIKCVNVTEGLSVKIPYVKIANTEVGERVLSVTPSTIHFGKITNSDYLCVVTDCQIEGKTAIDFALEEFYEVEIEQSETEYDNGIVLDKSGKVLGFSYVLENETGNVLMPVSCVNLFLDEVVESYENSIKYENQLVEKLVTLDNIQIECYSLFYQENNADANYFYYKNSWRYFSDKIVKFVNSGIDACFVIEDFVLNETKVLESGNVILSVQINNKKYETKSQVDLLNRIYGVKSGDNVTFTYLIDSSDSETHTVSVKI